MYVCVCTYFTIDSIYYFLADCLCLSALKVIHFIKDDTVNFAKIRKMIWSRIKQPPQNVSVTRRPLPLSCGLLGKPMEADAFLGLPEEKLHQILP